MNEALRLESALIPPEFWEEHYEKMPQPCKDVVDSEPDVIGIGWCLEVGWFVLGAGQGPHLIWKEKE